MAKRFTPPSSANRSPRRQARSTKRLLHGAPSKRTKGTTVRHQSPFVPPEDWYEPQDDEEATAEFAVVEQAPGSGYGHVVSEGDIRDRLAELPESWLYPLQVVQLSTMTRKKRRFPCYGMQWGPAIYLYPVEEERVEYFGAPPKPSQVIEAKMYGGRWREHADGFWTLSWSESALRDFYLNNVLIHELGHLLDDRNSNYHAREAYAEWFAIEYGYRPTRSRPARAVRRRHHG